MAKKESKTASAVYDKIIIPLTTVYDANRSDLQVGEDKIAKVEHNEGETIIKVSPHRIVRADDGTIKRVNIEDGNVR